MNKLLCHCQQLAAGLIKLANSLSVTLIIRMNAKAIKPAMTNDTPQPYLKEIIFTSRLFIFAHQSRSMSLSWWSLQFSCSTGVNDILTSRPSEYIIITTNLPAEWRKHPLPWSVVGTSSLQIVSSNSSTQGLIPTTFSLLNSANFPYRR